MSRKSLVAFLVLACTIAWAIGSVAVDLRRSPMRRIVIESRGEHDDSNQPRTILERMMERREAATRGARLAGEPTRSGEDAKADAGEQDAFDQWFFSQRRYPGTTMPFDAVGNAHRHASDHNKDDRDDTKGPPFKPLGPSTIPDGQTDRTAGQLSSVSGRVNAIATDPSNPNIAYAGGAQGGVWKTTNARSAEPHWEPLTDQEASQAVGAIAVDPVDPDIVYVGTGEANRACDSYYGQGILRSNDGGKRWTLLGSGGNSFNNPGPFVGKAIAKILIDPATAGSTQSTTIWAATTIGVFSGGTIPTCESPSGPNVGLWRSTDSGQTWELQNVPAGQAGLISVQDAAIDPTDGNIVYAAVRNTGVFKSVNAKAAGGGATYTRMGTGFPIGSNVTPVRRINVGLGGAAARNTIYAAIENGNNADQLFGLFKSSNGGATWSNIDDGFNGSARFTNAAVVVNGSTLTLGVVTRLSGPSFKTDGTWVNRRLLVTLTGGAGAVLSRTVFRVLDGDHLVLASTTGFAGATTAQYSVASYPAYCNGQCFYDMTIAVDPADPTGGRIYVGGNPQTFSPNAAPNLSETPCDPFSQNCPSHSNWRSDDGGHTWASISQGDGVSGSLHTDDHAYAFGPDGSVYDGNDGGIWRSGNRGVSWTSMNTDIAVTQFQGVAIDARAKLILGGTQDNGTNLRNAKLADPPAWFHADFGDGGMSVIDQGTPMRMFHTYFNQAFNFMGPARSDVGGSGGPGSWPFAGAYYGYGPQYYNGMDPTEPVSFYAPLTHNPALTPNVIYFGSNRVYRSPDPQPTLAQTPSWTAVSPPLTKLPDGYISWIGVLPRLVAGKEVLYTGSSDGRIAAASKVTGAGMATWTFIDKAPLPNRAVSQVLPIASDATGNTVFATFSGFSSATPTTPGHVFRSTNGLGAATWTDISGDLPDVPANAIAVDPTTKSIVVGTDIGVFESTDGGAHWRHLTKGMPNIAVFGLVIDSDGRLVASTHGRGMFERKSTGSDK